ncbi:MAG: heme-binding protein, partial [Planctomycetes bacterium]|nr:heme-binding protein [Planctomycetota bacterium]
GALAVVGESVPFDWLVNPTASAELTADEVRDIIVRGIAEAEKVRSAIRLPVGQRSRMVLAVTDLEGEVLGLFRMSDATFFSIDVAVAKARNVAYYADASELKPIDQIDADGDGNPDVAAGVALTNRTFRFISEARFPDGIEQTPPGPFSTLNTPGVDPATGENMLGVTPDASDFTTVLGFDAFNPGSNFHEDVPATGFQNGVVFFPGSTPLYRNGQLVGGLGISGDGVDQDDVVTFSAAGEFLPRLNANDSVTRADEVFVRGVRLPYQKFLRNPRG